jgi:hypothetical protein
METLIVVLMCAMIVLELLILSVQSSSARLLADSLLPSDDECEAEDLDDDESSCDDCDCDYPECVRGQGPLIIVHPVSVEIEFSDSMATKKVPLLAQPHCDQSLAILPCVHEEGKPSTEDELTVVVSHVTQNAYSFCLPVVSCYTDLKVGEFRDRLLSDGWEIDDSN